MRLDALSVNTSRKSPRDEVPGGVASRRSARATPHPGFGPCGVVWQERRDLDHLHVLARDGAGAMTTAATDPVLAWPPSAEFWSSEFPARTDGAVAPYLFKGLVPADRLGPDDVLDGLRRLRRAATQGELASARTRVYVGEQRRDEVADTVLSSPWSDEEFVAWMQDLTGADRFSLVINNLETTSPKLAAVLGELIGSAHAGWGVPIGGSEQVAFAGNYAGTAFGVHEGYEDAFLVHLGPGIKHFSSNTSTAGPVSCTGS